MRFLYLARFFFTKQFFGFALVGGVTLLSNGALRLLLNNWLSFSVSLLSAYIISMGIAFPLHRIYIFPGSTQSVEKSARDFLFVNLLLLPVVWLLSFCFALLFLHLGVTTHAHTLAHGSALIFPKLGAFFAYKFFVFRKKKRPFA